jgi:hypothetical protein
MKQLVICFSLVITTVIANAQGADATQAIIRAYASGENNVATLGGSSTYDPAKKYIVFKFWNAKEPLSENEKADLDYLQTFLPKKNIQVVQLPYQNLSELKEAVKRFQLEFDDSEKDRFVIRGENFHMNTNALNALIVIEDGKPVTLCCGKFCELNLKQYFKLQTVN